MVETVDLELPDVKVIGMIETRRMVFIVLRITLDSRVQECVLELDAADTVSDMILD